MRIAKLSGAAVLACVVGVALGQTRPTPYLLNFDSAFTLVGYEYAYDFADVESKSPLLYNDKHSVRFIVSHASPCLRVIVDTMNGKLPYPKKTTIHRGDLAGPMIGFPALSLFNVVLPAVQSGSTTRGTLRMGFNADPAGPQFLGQQLLSPLEKELVKLDEKRTPWTLGAFHFKLDGVVDPLVTGISGIEIVNVGDLDGDGAPDFRTAGPIDIEIPEESLPKYLALDPATEHIFKICWLDDMGKEFFTLRGVVQIAGWGHADPFSAPGTAQKTKVRVTRGDSATASDTTCSMSGS